MMTLSKPVHKRLCDTLSQYNTLCARTKFGKSKQKTDCVENVEEKKFTFLMFYGGLKRLKWWFKWGDVCIWPIPGIWYKTRNM